MSHFKAGTANRTLVVTAGVLCVVVGFASPGFARDAKWDPVGQALGKSGSVMPGGIYRVGRPRTDLHVTLDGIELKPTFALGSWVAFEPAGKQTVVMGDLVLTEDEIEPVMKSLVDGGLQITALHNHLFHAQPATFYMHVFGEGDATTLARKIHTALALSKTPFTADAAPAPPPASISTQPP